MRRKTTTTGYDMQVAVLGAGVVGITTAHYLLERGHYVTVIDRDDSVAAACSFANGAQLSYSYVDAMASPSFLARIPGLLVGVERAIRIRPPLSRHLLRWGSAFMAECTSARAARNTVANLELASRSRELLADLRGTLPGSFDYREAGKLVLLSKPKDVENARRASNIKSSYGCDANVVSMDEAIGIEPAVAQMAGNYCGAVWSPGDDVGDAGSFTRLLAEKIADDSRCRMWLGTEIKGLVIRDGRLGGVFVGDDQVGVDAVVVCLGSWSPNLLRPHGIDLPIVPARGYSVTLAPGPSATSVSITDFSSRFVISRIGERIRVAGFADFYGFDTSRDRRRVAALLETAATRAPGAAEYRSEPNHAWGGFRPLTPNGQPIIGPTRIDGLYLNTGHGSFGWTLACASGYRIARQISNDRVAALAA